MSAGTLRDLAGRVGGVHGHPRQGVLGGSKCGCRRSHFRNQVSGTAGVFDKPGQEVQRHVSMRVPVLGDGFPGPG